MADVVIFIAPQPDIGGYEDGTDDTGASKVCTVDEPDFYRKLPKKG